MSYENALVLIELASYLSANRTGVSFRQIEERMRISHRQAQRLIGHLRAAFPDLEERDDGDGRKLFKLARPQLCDMAAMTAEQLAALEHAINALELHGETPSALLSLRDHVKALLPASRAARIGTDVEALLESQGFVARPGPREAVNPAVIDVLHSALLGCNLVAFDYASGTESVARPRRVKPLGILSGLRRYLAALPDMDGASVRTYRLDKIATVTILDEWFERPADFDLAAFAGRGFGAYQDEREFGEVVWLFAPEAAARARGWMFHPDQQFEDRSDGSLIVRFSACGHLEMCWHLYAWGDKVRVLSPPTLEAMVAAHRRSDFASMP